jgi:hypothetical protein
VGFHPWKLARAAICGPRAIDAGSQGIGTPSRTFAQQERLVREHHV